MGLHDLYEFELVPVDDDAIISAERWSRVQYLLLEFQPAKTATLVGDPPRCIRILGYGGTEVAPGLLQKISEAAGTPLRVAQT
jgi:hypothetical protein